MRALVVYETMFGNTRAIAEAIAEGLSIGATVEITDVADAPLEIPPEVDVLVVGGPTHVFSMSRRQTRQEALAHGAPSREVEYGIRGWLATLPVGGHPQDFAAFDTRVDTRLIPGAASRSATRVARHLGFRTTKPESFLVGGYEGPLISGELDRAREWGRQLSKELAD